MTDPLIGKVLKDAYQIKSVLADGGMGMVYIAEQLSLGRDVVLKVLRPNLVDNDFAELFLREARINSQLNHPNVVSVFDFGKTDDNIVFLAMEYLDGQTIGDIVKAQGGLSLAKCLWVMEQICSSVHAAHKMHIVHRDIKPNNVMVSVVSGDTMVAKILDFGISKPLEERDLKHTRMGTVMGTPGYIAPEQISGEADIDIRADIYALGALLYFMITGQAPYEGNSGEVVMHKQLSSLPTPLSQSPLNDSDAAILQPVIEKAMQLERENRYQDVNSFWTDITQIASGKKNVGPQETPTAATRYYFVYKGKLDEGVSEHEAKLGLHKSLGYNPKQISKLFSGKSVVVRKNVSFEEANKLAEQFKQQGALGKIEEMQDATRIVTRPGHDPSTLPSVSRLEAISLADIKAAAENADKENQALELQNSHSISGTTDDFAGPNYTGPNISASQIIHGNQAANSSGKSKLLRVSLMALMSLSIIAAGIWFYLPLRYQLLDLYHYSIQGNPVPRGVHADTVNIGMSAAFSGSAREIGHSMRTGINTYFQHINDQGGVHGRQLKLIELDDGYEPARALANMDTFLDTEKGSFALIGNVGTPTAKAILPSLLDNRTIVFGTFSGSSILRNSPPDRYVFNYRASYNDETAALINYFTNELEISPSRIAVFYQNDSYGAAGLTGVEAALHKQGISHDDIVKASYERNTSQVSNAVEALSAPEQNIEAIVMVSTYAASAEFIKEMRQTGYTGQFANVSFVGSIALVERLQEIGVSGKDVLISQVVPPFNSYATGVLKYREHLKTYYPGENPNFISLEGYIVAQIFTEALIRSGRYFDTELVVEALETLENFDLGIGTPISFSLSNHQGSHRVWGTRINGDGEFESVDLTE